jgi:tRNA (Thr-GGU) A37 N-methylase
MTGRATSCVPSGGSGAPEADLKFVSRFADGIKDCRVGEQIIVLSWLNRAGRNVLVGHLVATSATLDVACSARDPDRPNSVGLHRVGIVSIEGCTVRVRNLEALGGTPVIDVQPIVEPMATVDRRHAAVSNGVSLADVRRHRLVTFAASDPIGSSLQTPVTRPRRSGASRRPDEPSVGSPHPPDVAGDGCAGSRARAPLSVGSKRLTAAPSATAPWRCASRARMLEIAPPASSLVGWWLPFLGADHRITEDSGASPL